MSVEYDDGASHPGEPERSAAVGVPLNEPRRMSPPPVSPAMRNGRKRESPVVLPGELVGGSASREVVQGSKLGSTYVRVRVSQHPEQFRLHGEDTVEATEATLLPRSRPGRAYERVRRVVIGQRLPTAAQVHERLTKVKALAVLSSDAISSVAYATEASLGVLIVAGIGALGFNPAIAVCIILLMVMVGTSYWQTIHAYPHGGGSYIVARDNLGIWPGLVAAAALLIDYVLTVSVSVSSGIDALVSAIPLLQHISVELGVAAIVLIMAVNLRGIRESGTIFAAPTYFFIGAFLIMILVGVVHAALSPGGILTPVAPAIPPAKLGWGSERLSVLLVLTAFASGCSAMTGVEAISNGVPAFKAPEADNAARTLVWMVAILVTLFAGVTFLAWRFGIMPYPNQNPTVDAQIAKLLFVGPFAWFFFVVQAATLLILVLAANTSFADFPRLSSILARDGFLPNQFAFRGDRLAFSTGIIVLTLLSSLLLVAFRGSTDALINLYALGVFVAFTLSQTGMVIRWWRLRARGGPSWRRSLVINALGATTTGIVAAIIMVTKFDRGAWIVVLLVPLLVAMFHGISKHYESVRQQVMTLPVRREGDARTIVLVPIAQMDRVALRSLRYAQSLTSQVIALHVSSDPEHEAELRAQWAKWAADQGPASPPPEPAAVTVASRAPALTVPQAAAAAASPIAAPRLVVIESPYRSLVAPLVSYVDAVRDANPGATVTIILPEFVPAHWWERILHNQTALRLKLALYSHPGVVVSNVPYHLNR